MARQKYKTVSGWKIKFQTTTTATIVDDSAGICVTGKTFLGESDKFDRNLGNKIALTRALRELFGDMSPAMARRARKEFWCLAIETGIVEIPERRRRP